MEMYQDGVPVYVLPEGAMCRADEYKRSPLDIEICPLGMRYVQGTVTNMRREWKMSNLKLVYVCGNWVSADILPKNDPDKYYAVTLLQTKAYFNMIPDSYWRYYNDRWEWYGDGVWHDDYNPLFRVTAYMEIVDIKPCEAR